MRAGSGFAAPCTGLGRARRWVIAALTLAAWAFAPTAVHAGGDADPTGLDLLERCHALKQPAGDAGNDDAARDAARMRGYCIGYLVGFVSGFAARDAAGAASRFCPPVTARIGDFAAAVEEWLVAHPDGLDAMGAVAALQAFQRKFPCPDAVKQEEGPSDRSETPRRPPSGER